MAKETKSTRISYLKGYEQDVNFPIVTPVYGHVSFSNSGVKRYHSVLMTICGVSGIARDLMEWLTAQMDKDNRVHNTKTVRNAFILFIAPNRKKPPTHSAINASFATLKKKNLLIDMGRSCFMVNPEHFINSANEDSRPRLIRMVLEFRNGENVKITNNL